VRQRVVLHTQGTNGAGTYDAPARKVTMRSFVVSACLMASCSAIGAGAATYHVKFDYDNEVCSAFLAMVKARGIERMTDDELCDFRFAKGASLESFGFSFPEKHAVTVDQVAEFVRIFEASDTRGRKMDSSIGGADALEAIKKAVQEDNLRFSTFPVTFQGDNRTFTMLSADFKACSKGLVPSRNTPDQTVTYRRYMDQIGMPYQIAFTGIDLREPLRLALPVAQILLWKKTIPIEVTVPTAWVTLSGSKPWGEISLSGMRMWPAEGNRKAYVSGYLVCSAQIY
jgi:hypothetical protein